MRKYGESMSKLELPSGVADFDEFAHTFAHEAMVIRRFDPNDLWVNVLQTALDHEITYSVENILNRINYPLCGRN
jgi:hypothetical protein